MQYYAGIDVGGTKIYAIVIDEDGQILSRAKVKVGGDTSFDVVLEKMMECYQSACAESGIAEARISAVA